MDDWLDFVVKESSEPSEEMLYKQECYEILGACFAVYKDKGCGFLEAVYQECLEIEFAELGILFVAQPILNLHYRGRILHQNYMPDFLCFNSIIVEIKAVNSLASEHRAQLMNYLKATGQELGLLVNFGHYPKVEYERIAFTQGRYSRQ